MPHDPILHRLGLAKKAGRLEIGEEPVGAAARAHQARVLLLAADAAPTTVRRAAHFGEAGGALWLKMPFTKAELGEQLGRSSCAMLAVTDFGFAAALAERGVTAWLSPAGDGVWSVPSLSIRFYSPGAASRSSILLLSCRGYDTDGELVAFCD